MDKTIRLFHWTHARNLASIYKWGLSTLLAQMPFPAVYAVKEKFIPWAMAHCMKRHDWPMQDLRLLRVDAPNDDWLPVNARGVYATLRTVEPEFLTHVFPTFTLDENMVKKLFPIVVDAT